MFTCKPEQEFTNASVEELKLKVCIFWLSETWLMCFRLCVSEPECKAMPSSDSLSDTFHSVVEDTEKIMQKLSTIITKLDDHILLLCETEATSMDADAAADAAAAAQETKEPETSVRPDNTGPTTDTEQTSDCGDAKDAEKELEAKGQVSDNEECVSPGSQTEAEKTEERINVKGKGETRSEWTTVG